MWLPLRVGVEAHFSRDSHCALGAGEHHTDEHKCRVEGCSVSKGQACAHSKAR